MDASCSAANNPLFKFSQHLNANKKAQEHNFTTSRDVNASIQNPHQVSGMQDAQMFSDFLKAGPEMRHTTNPTIPAVKPLQGIRLQRVIPAVDDSWSHQFGKQGDSLLTLSKEESNAMSRAFHEAQMHHHSSVSNWHTEFENFKSMPPVDGKIQEVTWTDDFIEKNFVVAQSDQVQLDQLEQVWDRLGDEYMTSKELPGNNQLQGDMVEEFEKFNMDDHKNTINDGDFQTFEEIWKEQEAEGYNFGEDSFFEGAWDDGGNFSDPHVQLGEYQFEPDNPFMEDSIQVAFEKGLELMEKGSLSMSALAFEAVVQRQEAVNDETSKVGDAWMFLGLVQAENEKEKAAIRALERSLKDSPENLMATMALAVSYTNEGYNFHACKLLKQWIETKYPGFSGKIADDNVNLQQEVADRFIAVAQHQHETKQPVDADLQLGLGVLFYNQVDYDKAIDCFKTALSVRPNDHILWNRLGATLANSGKSEEAIASYYKALELKPTFVRARYNLGVSCINIGCYKEAAEHILGALLMHDSIVSPSGSSSSHPGKMGQVHVSQNLWETLRRAFLLMERDDLVANAIVGADLNQFRNEFEF